MNSDGKYKYNFQKLTPVDTCDLTIYEDAFNFAFNNEDILNIAVTGAYGSGKSSVIKSYQKKNDIKIIYTSLAYFNEYVQEDSIIKKSNNDNKNSQTDISNNDVNSTNKEQQNVNANKYTQNQLEAKIINQLVQQIKPEKIPLTDFKIKSKPKNHHIAINTILAISALIVLLYIINSKLPYHILTIVLLLLLSAFFIGKIVKMQMSRNFLKRLKLPNCEVELDGKSSVIDKHLDEILYVLRNSDTKAIVFEDIDRHNNNLLFIKLREVNFLLNQGDTKIKFIYVLKDDAFNANDKTKFFDFIIPIIPILDGTNSYEYFSEYLSEELYDEDKQSIKNPLFENFLKTLSFYIDDMRMVRNICNEYFIYKRLMYPIDNQGKLLIDKKNNLTDYKLLAMVAYKNRYPDDFINCQKGNGFLNYIFRKNNIGSEERIKIISSELDKYYQGEYEDNDNFDIVDALEDENSKLKKMSLADTLGDDYISRKLGLDSIFSDKTIKNDYHILGDNGMIRMLLTNRYIEESFNDYISYFNEGRLKVGDKNFIRSVYSRDRLSYDYKIESPQLVIESIDDNEFNKIYILNFDIINSLFDQIFDNDKKRENILHLLNSDNVDITDFILRYLSKYDDQNFLRTLLYKRKTFLTYAKKKNFDITPILQRIANYSDIELIKMISKSDKNFNDYFINAKDKLLENGVDKDKLNELSKLLQL